MIHDATQRRKEESQCSAKLNDDDSDDESDNSNNNEWKQNWPSKTTQIFGGHTIIAHFGK